MTLNAKWHKENPMPKKITLKEKIQWHADHNRECGCREIPPKIKEEMTKRKPTVVVGILVKHENKFLLVREKIEGEKEKWLFPGGKVEFGESLEDAAKRELEEETGIKVSEMKFLCFKEAQFADYNYHSVIFFYSTETDTKTLEGDIEGKVLEARWVSMDEAKLMPLVESAKWLFEFLEK